MRQKEGDMTSLNVLNKIVKRNKELQVFIVIFIIHFIRYFESEKKGLIKYIFLFKYMFIY